MRRSRRGNILSLLAAAVVAIVLALGQAAEAKDKPLYERLGGVHAIAAVVDEFVNRLLANPTITGNQKVAEASMKITGPGLKYLLTEQICAASGGPQKYSGRSMKESHKGLGITEREWDAMVKEFVATLEKFKVPQKEQQELIALVAPTKKDIVTGR